jgi:hypothetical protein
MSLLSKNKPTERVNFDGGYVELQFLSKGVKDKIQTDLAALYEDLEKIQKIHNVKEGEELPKDINMDVLAKINEVEYYKLSRAIKSWSEDEPINEETVKGLDDEIFDQITSKINEMNTLNKAEIKN